MSKFVIVVFSDELRAHKGRRVLRDLHEAGSISVYALAVMRRDITGRTAVTRPAESGPLGLGVSALMGGFGGLFAGPVGAALGMGFGALIGGISDLFNAGVGADFVNRVTETLLPGRVALVAEVEEELMTPLDLSMDELGGVVIREWRSEFEEMQIDKEVAGRQVELATLRVEFDYAVADRRATLRSRLDRAMVDLVIAGDRAQARMHKLRQETQARIAKLQEQMTLLHGPARNRIERQIAQIQSDYDRRSGKLAQAWELTKESLVA